MILIDSDPNDLDRTWHFASAVYKIESDLKYRTLMLNHKWFNQKQFINFLHQSQVVKAIRLEKDFIRIGFESKENHRILDSKLRHMPIQVTRFTVLERNDWTIIVDWLESRENLTIELDDPYNYNITYDIFSREVKFACGEDANLFAMTWADHIKIIDPPEHFW